jgi:hypothetical protein
MEFHFDANAVHTTRIAAAATTTASQALFLKLIVPSAAANSSFRCCTRHAARRTAQQFPLEGKSPHERSDKDGNDDESVVVHR